MKFSIAPSKIPYSEIIANTEGALHDSRAEVGEIAEVRAHFVETLLDSPSVHNQNLKKIRKNEHLVLRSLYKDHFMIITKADTVVVLYSDDYDKKVIEILNDSNTYGTISYRSHRKICQGSPKRAFFHKRNSSSPRFYGLPKIHKTGNPHRPIVFSFNSPTAKIGKFLSVVFRPLIKAQKSYIKNSTDFVSKLKQISAKPNTKMGSFDADSIIYQL